ncbi:MAG: ABC transporter substrate-binding protein [Nocardiaceae bacterium]|nr:ABC transporter substrate-binding protein [Nocardiaceae bacterium]
MRVYKKAAIAACLSTVAVLAACSSGDKAAGGAGENLDSRGNITMAMGKNDAATVKTVVDMWNKNHPDEKVALKELDGEADSQLAKLTQSLEAGSDEYDVMALDVVWTGKFAANGWVEPLEGKLAVDTSKVLPATVESATYKGKVYAAPMNTNAQLLYYRTDLVSKAPKTWDDLTADCAKAKTAKVDCLVTQLKQYEGLTVNTSEFINSWGGSIVGEDGQTPTVDTPEAKAGLTALVDAYKDGVIPKAATGYNEEGTHTNFLAGKSMFAYNWPYMYDKAAGDDSKIVGKYDVAAIVGEDGAGASTLGGYNNAINVNSKHKATARDFIAFVEGTEAQTEFANNSFPPVLASLYDDKELVDKYGYFPALKAALENAKPRPVTPFYDGVSKAIQDNAYAALTGKKTVDQALADMSAAIKAAAK